MRTQQYLDHLDQAPSRIVLDMGFGVTIECDPCYGVPHEEVAQRWVRAFVVLWDEPDLAHTLITEDGTRRNVMRVVEA